MRALIAALVSLLCVANANAAEKPLIGTTPPSWVVPADVKLDIPADGQPARVLLQDLQLRFGEDGDSTYMRTVLLIGTSQGLASVGSISFSWNPETDTISVHRLVIRRGATTIDVLKRQTFSILRRESNLEYAMLDGVLTANMQIEGLAIGDVVEVETTLLSKNPLMRGLSEHSALGLGQGSSDHLRLRALWPTTRRIVWRGLEEFAKAIVSVRGSDTELLVDLKQLTPIELPQGAPMRFQFGRGIEFSEFHSWGDVSALMAPLYASASQLGASSPLNDEIARIKASSKDPKIQAAAALSLVESQVRYVFVGLDLGGLKPADADDSWQRKFGDCKAKTVLLLALLKGLGIEAQPTLVATYGGDSLVDRLPNVGAFNHVFVRATIGGKVYWLDATRTGDTSLDLLRTPAYHWTLPVQSSGAKLVPLVPELPTNPDFERSLELDSSAGFEAKAKAHAEVIMRDDAAYAFYTGYTGAPLAERNKGMRDYWRATYDFIEPTNMTETYDPATRLLTLKLDGVAEMNWQDQNGLRYFDVDDAALGEEVDFKREPGPLSDAPFAVAYPYYTRAKVSIRLPDEGRGYIVQGSNVDKTLAGTAYKRKSTIAGGVFQSEVSTRTIAPEFPASEAAGAQRALKELANEHVLAVRSRAAGTTGLTSAADYTTRGNSKLQNSDYAGAAKDYDAAIALDPNYAAAYSNRGITNYWLARTNEARADFDKAKSLAPSDIVVEHGYGLLALDAGNNPEAIKHMSAAIAIDPNDAFGHFYRGIAEAWIDRYDAALADAAELRRLSPNSSMSYDLRTQIFKLRGDMTAAIEERTQAIAAAPNETDRYWARAEILLYAGKPEDADKDFRTALEMEPSAQAYLTRVAYRGARDFAGRRSDLAAALKLDPKSVRVLALAADTESMAGDYKKALSFLEQALAIAPNDTTALTYRGRAHARAGKRDAAQADFAAVRKAVSEDANGLNSLCWNQATAGVELEAALADCNASLELKRTAPTLDSRGFVELRLGKFDAALRDFNEALQMKPQLANSLFGRAIVKASKGQKAEAERDKVLALRVSPLIVQAYESYGLLPP